MAVCPSCHQTNPEEGAACPRCEGWHYIPEKDVEDAATDPMIGRIAASKYVILGLISEGGMGAVYRALQLPVQREVAFKVLRTELKDSDNGRGRFMREATAVSRLNHANIITLYDYDVEFEDGKHPYMVMEYAPGKSLAKWLRTENVTTERVLRVTAQILGALDEAHSHGIVHRDLKPENMIISPKGNDPDRVKLLDFGIARMINESATRGITREGEVFGTPHYMAPEQAQGRKEIGPPADVYAVGIMLWEMLCGDCPFDAPTPLAVLFMHINDPIPPLTPREGVEIVPGLEQIVQRATAKDPKDRYQTANEMLADISQVFARLTGAHPGMMYGEPSQEFAKSDAGLFGSSDSGLRSAQTPIPFGPLTSDIGSGVHINDPDPSRIGAPPSLPGEESEPGTSNAKLGVLAVVVVVAILGVGSVLMSMVSSTSEAGADPNTTLPVEPEPETPRTDEIAAAAEPAEIEIEPLPPTEPPVEPDVVEEPEQVEEAPKPDPVEEKPKPVEEKPKPKPKPKPEKKPEKKPDPVEEKPKPDPKEEPEHKPTKFSPKPQKWN